MSSAKGRQRLDNNEEGRRRVMSSLFRQFEMLTPAEAGRRDARSAFQKAKKALSDQAGSARRQNG